jgi:hypothetical protein
MKLIISLLIVTVVTTSTAWSQIRVVVLPFRNMDGEINLNEWCYSLADSLRTKLLEINPNQKVFIMVPQDSVEMAIAALNLDPDNVQYESDIWTAMNNIHADRVVQGNFFRRHTKVLMNAYVYDVEFKMADPEHQAKDLYKDPSAIMEAVPTMAKRLYPALIKPMP